MYFPWDIARFRAAIEQGAREVFDGVPFTSTPVMPAGDDAHVTVLEPPHARTMTGPAALFGTPEDQRCLNGVGTYELRCPARHLYTVSQGRLVGNSSVIDGDGHLYWPDLVVTPEDLQTAATHNANNTQAYVLRHAGTSATAFFYWSGTQRRIDGTGLLLPNPEPGNYGSFLFRVLPHLLEAARLNLKFDFVITSDRSHWLLDAIRLVGLPLKPILLAQEIFGHVVSGLTFFNDFCLEGFVPRSTAEALRALHSRIGSSAHSRSSQLYVSRALSRLYAPRYRLLRNELDIEEQARRRGCFVVYPETLPFAEQISLFGQAHRLAGPSGSGMLNAMFAPEGARVLDMESFHVTVRQHAKIYASTGKIYGFAFGTFDPDDQREFTTRNWSLEPRVMASGLDWLFQT